MSLFAVTKPFDILLFTASSVLCALLAYWITTRYRTRGAQTFALLLGLVSFWAANSVVKLTIQSLQAQATIVRTDFVLMFLVPIVWFVFAARYTGRDIYRERTFLAFVVCLVGSGIVLSITNPASLVFQSLPATADPFLHIHPNMGALYWPYLAAGYGFLLAGIGFLVRVLLTTSRNELPIGTILLGSVFAFGFNVIYIFEVGVFHNIDYTSFGFGLFAVLSTFAVSQNLFDIAPISREIVMDSIESGMVVVGTDRRIINYNDEAGGLAARTDDLTGVEFGQAFPAFAGEFDFETEAVTGVATPTDENADGEPTRTIVETTGADGQRRHYSVAMSRIDRGSLHLGWAFTFTDVTEMQETQRELTRQNEQLDQFASTVSHDLRNPLTVLVGSAELLEMPLHAVHEGDRSRESLDTTELLEHTRKIKTTAARMETIIDDLLTLTTQGKTVTDTEPVDITSVVTAARECVETQNSRVVVQGNGVVLASRTRLQTILENLLRNAIEHGGPNVSITVSVDEDGFSVQDDGPGIPDSETEDIFEYGHSTRAGGTGLGLAIVKTMAEAHGWSIAVDTNYTDGTRIRFGDVDVVTVERETELVETPG